jgi:hypothetical protein
LVIGGSVMPRPSSAMTQILPDATVEADRQTVLELTSTFDQAQEAIRSRNLDGLMAIYSERYNHHGFKKADLRKIWDELLSDYEFIANIHTFSAIRTSGEGNNPMVEITCSGALWATSKNSKERIPIDSWHQEVHHLVNEDGEWRIVGSSKGASARPRLFGSAPHPLF